MNDQERLLDLTNRYRAALRRKPFAELPINHIGPAEMQAMLHWDEWNEAKQRAEPHCSAPTGS